MCLPPTDHRHLGSSKGPKYKYFLLIIEETESLVRIIEFFELMRFEISSDGLY